MKIGFIGTGKIAYSVITGICNSKISFTKIVISSRNKKVANKLKKKFKRVIIGKNNQKIIDNCDWIFFYLLRQWLDKKLSKNLSLTLIKP